MTMREAITRWLIEISSTDGRTKASISKRSLQLMDEKAISDLTSSLNWFNYFWFCYSIASSATAAVPLWLDLFLISSTQAYTV